MALAIREPARRGGAPTTGKISLLPLWREMRTNRLALVTIMLGTIMNVMIVNAQLAWFPTLFFRVHEWTPARVGNALALVGVPFGLFSAITAGWALSWLANRGRDDGPVLVMGLQCAAWAIFGTLKCLAPTPQLALAGHVATSLFATWAVTSALTALNQMTPNRLRGQVVAIYTLLTAFVGVALGSVAGRRAQRPRVHRSEGRCAEPRDGLLRGRPVRHRAAHLRPRRLPAGGAARPRLRRRRTDARSPRGLSARAGGAGLLHLRVVLEARAGALDEFLRRLQEQREARLRIGTDVRGHLPVAASPSR